MTQKQTDYDKALQDAKDLWKWTGATQPLTSEDVIDFAFRKGYEYGKKQSTADHERNLIALGDDYMTARENAIQTGLLTIKDKSTYEAYRLGWNDSDAFDDEWTAQHPKDLLSRILADHPEIIEDEVSARMKDLENENREKQQNSTICDFRKDKSLMRYEIAKVATQAIISNNNILTGYRKIMEHSSKSIDEIIAIDAVGYADALIKELGKEEE